MRLCLFFLSLFVKGGTHIIHCLREKAHYAIHTSISISITRSSLFLHCSTSAGALKDFGIFTLSFGIPSIFSRL